MSITDLSLSPPSTIVKSRQITKNKKKIMLDPLVSVFPLSL